MTTAVCLFAHPDDEFALYPIIEKEIYEGICCIYLTDGGYGDQDCERRMLESQIVLNKIGIQIESILFVGAENGIPDGELCAHMPKAIALLKKLLSNYLKIRSLYIPAWEGGHQDHDATHLIGIALAIQLGIFDKTYQFPIYNGANLPGPLFRVFFPLLANGEVFCSKISINDRIKYLKYILSYPSQLKTWIGLFPFVLIFYLFKGRSFLQKVSIDRLTEAPHGGKLLYERRGFMTSERFISYAFPFYIHYIESYLKISKING